MSPINLKPPFELGSTGELRREFVGIDKLGEVVLIGYLDAKDQEATVDFVIQDGDSELGHRATCRVPYDSPEEVQSMVEDFTSSAGEIMAAMARSSASDKMIARKLRSI